jgi:hypothetical protein
MMVLARILPVSQALTQNRIAATATKNMDWARERVIPVLTAMRNTLRNWSFQTALYAINPTSRPPIYGPGTCQAITARHVTRMLCRNSGHVEGRILKNLIA